MMMIVIPVHASQTDKRLDIFFEKLKVSSNEREAKFIETQI